MQLIPDTAQRDDFPLADMTLNYEKKVDYTKWCKEALSTGATLGLHRRAFIACAEEAASTLDANEVKELRKEPYPDKLVNAVTALIMEAGRYFYCITDQLLVLVCIARSFSRATSS